jgi:hypothetical protein
VVAGLVALLIVALGARAAWMIYETRSAPERLAIKWEGAVIDRNFRDAGASLDACLGEPLFAEGAVLRSNVWFSGWSCASIGEPDVIYSLNFDPAKGERYFCQDDGRRLVGRVFNPELKLNDLEFVETWDKPGVTPAVCAFLADAAAELAKGSRVLVHCDAGKDRTATFVALLYAMAAERRGRLDERLLTAIECDYRRSRALEADKYGRMRAFVEALTRDGGVGEFVATRCGLAPEAMDAVARRLTRAAPKS